MATPAPSLTPAPTALPRCSASEFINQSASISRRFRDANQRALVTPRLALSAVVGEMQQIRRDYENISAPNCAKTAQQAFIDAMNSDIDVLLAFLGQANDYTMKAKSGDAVIKWEYANKEIEKLIRSAP